MTTIGGRMQLGWSRREGLVGGAADRRRSRAVEAPEIFAPPMSDKVYYVNLGMWIFGQIGKIDDLC